MEAMDSLWRRAFGIRAFEERLLALFAEGKVQGTVHTCSGQEWSALAVAAALGPDDFVFSNHRGHGHFLARHPDKMTALLAEIMGRRDGLCRGVGGSQHLYAPNFLSNGIQGGMTPIAAGVALARVLQGSDAIAAVFIGDGTTGEGVLYETMNIAAAWNLPLLIVLERNGYAQSTPTAETIAGAIERRAAGFGFAYHTGGVWEPQALLATASEAVGGVRNHRRPALLEIECFRLNAHSKGDDTRPAEVVRAFRDRDPLAAYSREAPDQAARFAAEADRALDEALANLTPDLCDYAPPSPTESVPVAWSPAPPPPAGRYGEAVYRALRRRLETHPLAVMLGEDIAAPYGGAFAITRDLSDRFPGRVRNTPISEAALVGMGTGLALAGCPSAVEIMFGDFLTLAFDQMQQHAAKFTAMSGGALRVPLIVRTPMGGRRGYGPTHSQSLEKHFLGVPGLGVAALNRRINPDVVYPALARTDMPWLVVENKSLYSAIGPAALPAGYAATVTDEPLPTLRLRPDAGAAAATIVCYGGMLEHVEAALETLWREDEVLCDVLCYTRLHPLNPTPFLESLAATGRVLTVEEGPAFAAWGAEMLAQAACAGIPLRRAGRLGYDGLIPASAARESQLLPDAAAIRQALLRLVT